jgi:hypothetical protein
MTRKRSLKLDDRDEQSIQALLNGMVFHQRP